MIMWSLAAGRRVTEYRTLGALSGVAIWSLDVHHDCNRLVTGAQNCTVALFDLDRRRPVRLWAEASAVDCVRIAGDGNLYALLRYCVTCAESTPPRRN